MPTLTDTLGSGISRAGRREGVGRSTTRRAPLLTLRGGDGRTVGVGKYAPCWVRTGVGVGVCRRVGRVDGSHRWSVTDTDASVGGADREDCACRVGGRCSDAGATVLVGDGVSVGRMTAG